MYESLMAKKILVFQHSPFEPLGLLIPLIKKRKIRIRFLNFYREDYADIDMNNYDALIVLGGPQHPTEFDKYPHLKYETQLIEKALSLNKPIMGICLGAQLLALALGAKCIELNNPEFGWLPVEFDKREDLFSEVSDKEFFFQWHQYACTLPQGAKAYAKTASSLQVFNYHDFAYGLQCHLEAEAHLLKRWLGHPEYLEHLKVHLNQQQISSIINKMDSYLPRSIEVANQVFQKFLDLIAKDKVRFSSMHGGS